ncbi:hypothetical protein U370_00765 [Anaplasma marginale str. Dawn]|nr:hypothetical protein U370_00765 [Anaplasma marginale str. Dawn]
MLALHSAAFCFTMAGVSVLFALLQRALDGGFSWMGGFLCR